MPAPSPEVVVENLRRSLHEAIPFYAQLRPQAVGDEVEDDLVELALLLGMEWASAQGPENETGCEDHLSRLLETLCEAAREDQQATYEMRNAAKVEGQDAETVPMVTMAVDRWLDRCLTGKEAGRLP